MPRHLSASGGASSLYDYVTLAWKTHKRARRAYLLPRCGRWGSDVPVRHSCQVAFKRFRPSHHPQHPGLISSVGFRQHRQQTPGSMVSNIKCTQIVTIMNGLPADMTLADLTLAPAGAAAAVTEPVDYRLSDLPVLWIHALIQQQLTAKARLILFQVSKGLATLVLQHAASVQLRLTGSSRSTAEQQQAQQHALETILAMVPQVHPKVVLDGGFLGTLSQVWADQIKQRVRHLTLVKLTLSMDLLQNLQLQHCSQLHTLELGHGCESAGHAQPFATFAAQYASILPPSLTRLITEDANPSAAEDMIHLVSPQLIHLSCSTSEGHRGLRMCPRDNLRQLGHVSLDWLDDNAMLCLVTLPNLTHVTAQHMVLQKDYSSSHLGWQQLRLGRGSDIQQLRLLPVRHIQQLVFRGSFICTETDTTKQELAHLAACPSIQCVPVVNDLSGQLEFTILGQYPSKLVVMCAKSLKVSGGLQLSRATFPCLQQLQPCITRVLKQGDLLRFCLDDLQDCQQVMIAQRAQILQQFVGALPQHIKQLIIDCSRSGPDICTYARAIVSHLQARQLQTKLVMTGYQGETVAAELQALARAHPGRMSCLAMDY